MSCGRLAAGATCIFLVVGCLPGWSRIDDSNDGIVSPIIASPGATNEKACTDAKAFAKAHCDRGTRCASNDAYFFWSWSGDQCEHWVASWYVGIFSLSSADDRIKACQSELEAPGCGPTPACADLNRQRRREKDVECSSTKDCKVGLACIPHRGGDRGGDVIDVCADRKIDGAACNDADDCLEGLSCLNSVCRPVVDGTTACQDRDDCHVTRDADNTLFWGYSRGADRFYCDDSTLKCRGVVRDRKQGEKCGEGKLCAAGLFCKGWLLNGEGLCTPQIKYGDKCDDVEGCLTCENGICKDPLTNVCK
jgi:hypothetical protein